jgi:hypothetical protein
MPNRRDGDSLEEEYDDSEDPAEDDRESDDDPETFACPFCGRELAEGADVCPKCGNFIGGSDDLVTTRVHAGWVIVTAIVLLAAIACGLTWWLR